MLLNSYRFGGAPFDPVSGFFGAAEKGFIYDPSDMDTLFQDGAGATAVTAAGQTVGRILDLSGNGYLSTQSSSGLMPTIETDGTLWWLEFPDANCFLESVVMASLMNTTGIIFAGIRYVSAIAVPFWFYNDTAGGFLAVSDSGSAAPPDTGVFGITSYSVDGVAVTKTRGALYTACAGKDTVLTVNNVRFTPNSYATNNKLRINGYLGVSGVVRLYSLIFRGAATDSTGIANGNAWTAHRCGVTL